MSTATLGLPLNAEPLMAEEKPKTVSIKLATDVVESARVVSALRGVSMTDMLSDFLRPILGEWEEEEIQKRASAKATQLGAKRKAGGK